MFWLRDVLFYSLRTGGVRHEIRPIKMRHL